MGAHFRLPGHSHGDICFLPVEKVASKDKFVLEAREEYWIEKYSSLKMDQNEKIEHGLNLKWVKQRRSECKQIYQSYLLMFILLLILIVKFSDLKMMLTCIEIYCWLEILMCDWNDYLLGVEMPALANLII